MKKSNKLYLRGSFTVETSFVLLVIFFIIIFIIYLSVFLYGKVVFTNASYIGAFRGTQKLSEGTEAVYKAVKSTSDEKIDFPTWVYDECKEKVSINASSVLVSYQAESDMRALKIVSILDAEEWKMNISGKAKYSDGISFIRNCRRVEVLFDGRKEHDNP